MAAVRKRTATATLEPNDELAEMEAELDSIPERLRAAEAAGDEQAILSAMARERALPALIRAARVRLVEQRIAEHEATMRSAAEEQARLQSEVTAARRDVDEATVRLKQAQRVLTPVEWAQTDRWEQLWTLRRELSDLRDGADQ
jgi:hypothetical protein